MVSAVFGHSWRGSFIRKPWGRHVGGNNLVQNVLSRPVIQNTGRPTTACSRRAQLRELNVNCNHKVSVGGTRLTPEPLARRSRPVASTPCQLKRIDNCGTLSPRGRRNETELRV